MVCLGCFQGVVYYCFFGFYWFFVLVYVGFLGSLGLGEVLSVLGGCFCWFVFIFVVS